MANQQAKPVAASPQSKRTVATPPAPKVTIPAETSVEAESVTVPEEPVKASIKKDPNDIVIISLFQKIEPPPIIGRWNGLLELGIPFMEEKVQYKVPRFVANHLVDVKRAFIAE